VIVESRWYGASMALSEIRKKYEVGRFVLDGAESDRLCRYLEMDEQAAQAFWREVATELGRHLDVEVAIDGFSVPAVFQTKLHDCLVYLLDRIESEKQREVLGDVHLPRRDKAPEVEEIDEHPPSEDTSAVAADVPKPQTQASDGPLRVNMVLDELSLSDPTAQESVDKHR